MTEDSQFNSIPKKAASYYDRNIQRYSCSSPNQADFIDEFLEFVKKDGSPKPRILDLGSGHGVNAEYMHSKKFDVVGIDLSRKMVTYSRKKYPQIDFRVGNMTKLPFRKETFDGILASYSLIHLPKELIISVLEKLNNILKPGGILYLSVQSGMSTQGFYSHPTIPGDRVFLNIFSRQEISKLLREAGFEILSKHTKRPMGKVFNFTKLFIIAKKCC